MKLILVFIGGGAGALLRYSFGVLVSFQPLQSFPFQTFAINIIGSFFAGFLFYFFDSQKLISTELRLFLLTGLLGGFTTFSAFSIENLTLLKEHQYSMAIIYAFTSVILGLLLAGIGYFIGSALQQSIK